MNKKNIGIAFLLLLSCRAMAGMQAMDLDDLEQSAYQFDSRNIELARFSHEIKILQSCKKVDNPYCQPQLIDSYLQNLNSAIKTKQKAIYKELSYMASRNKNQKNSVKVKIKANSAGRIQVVNATGLNKGITTQSLRSNRNCYHSV